MFVIMQWVDWLCMISMGFSCWRSCTKEAVLEAVYQTLCQCLGVCGATFSGDKNLPNTCQNNYRSHFGMACMTHTLILL